LESKSAVEMFSCTTGKRDNTLYGIASQATVSCSRQPLVSYIHSQPAFDVAMVQNDMNIYTANSRAILSVSHQ